MKEREGPPAADCQKQLHTPARAAKKRIKMMMTLLNGKRRRMGWKL
jgi:hypothetical protein